MRFYVIYDHALVYCSCKSSSGFGIKYIYLIIVIYFTAKQPVTQKRNWSKFSGATLTLQMSQSTGIRVGLNKGFIVTKREKAAKPVDRKGMTSTRVKFVRSLIREVAGLCPYEKRLLEFCKMGSDKSSKRCLKFAKARLGTHLRGKKKRDEIENLWNKMRREHH